MMQIGDTVSKQKLVRFYWPRAYYELEDLGYVRSLGQKHKGAPSRYEIIKTLPTPQRLRKEVAAMPSGA